MFILIPDKFAEKFYAVMEMSGFKHYDIELSKEKSAREIRIYSKRPIDIDLRWQVLERDNFTCKHCGSRRRLSVDHIYPEAKGGKSVLENLQTLCRICNSKKGTTT